MGDIETANRVGNVREVARLTKVLTGRGKHRGNIMPTKAADGKPLTESKQLLDAWQEFLGRKLTCADIPGAAYAPVTADDDNDGEVTEEELESCLRVLHDNKAPGCDGIPIEAYRGLPAGENQFPNRDCQRGALRCEMVSCDAVTSGFVSDLFTSSRSSGPRLLSSGVRTKQMKHARVLTTSSRIKLSANFRREQQLLNNICRVYRTICSCHVSG